MDPVTETVITEEQRETKAAEFAETVDWEGDAPIEKKEEPKEAAPTDQKTPEQEQAEAAEKTRLETLASEQGKTVDEIKQAEAKAADEQAAEQKRLEKLATEQGKTVEQIKADEKTATEQAEKTRLEAIAKEEGITVDEVIENEKKDQAIIERHANDAKKLARAIRKEQSEYGKLKSQLDEFKAEQERKAKVIDEKALSAWCEEKRDMLIEKYRENNPNSEDLSDDVVFDRAQNVIRDMRQQKITADKEAVKTSALNRRKEMVETLPPEYGEVKTDIREILDQVQDDQILNPKFDVTFIALAARGKKFTPDYIKQLTDSAYKRGVEQPKILGAVNVGKTTPASGSKPVVALTADEKDRAREMFGNKGWTEDKMFQEYEKNHKGKDF